MGKRRIRRRVVVTAIVVGVLVSTAIVVRQVWLRDTARAVGADQAVKRFRDSTVPATTDPVTTDQVTTDQVTTDPITTGPLPATLPAAGVYRYATTGFEHIDALGGTGHQYPEETTLTVTPDGCGMLLRWDLLRERREDWRLCVGEDGVSLQPTGDNYHEFYQHGELRQLTCDRPIVLVPVDHRPRSAVSPLCQLDQKLWLPEWTVMESSTRVVEGTEVRVTHVQMRLEATGEYYEHTIVDYWLDEHGLPVSIAGHKISKNSTSIVGDVVYTEEFTADLESLTPLR